MNCPRDKSPLNKKIYEDAIEVDECSTCGGMFLHKGELEKIQETIDNDYVGQYSRFEDHIGQAYAAARQKALGDIKCPSCDSEMSSREYGYCSQIFIDGCPHCGGVWLDKGELEALEVFFEKAGLETGRMRLSFFQTARDLFRR